MDIKEINGSDRRNPKRAAQRKEELKRKAELQAEKVERPQPTALIKESDEAVAIWEHTVDLLEYQQTLHKCDCLMLELFVFNALQLHSTSRDLLRHGHYDVAENGTSRRSALSVTFEKLTASHHKYLRELELTPATRPELVELEGEEGASMSDFLNSSIFKGSNN